MLGAVIEMWSHAKTVQLVEKRRAQAAMVASRPPGCIESEKPLLVGDIITSSSESVSSPMGFISLESLREGDRIPS